MTIVPSDAVLSWTVSLDSDECSDTVHAGYVLRIVGGEVIEMGSMPPAANSTIALALAETAIALAIGRCHEQPTLF